MSDSSLQVFGIHPVLEAIKSGKSIDKVWLLKDGKNQLDIIALAKQSHIKLSYVPQQKFRKYQSKNHQGVVAFLSPIHFADFEQTILDSLNSKQKTFFFLLDGVTDVRNVGSIVRTAESAGASAIIIPQQGSARINNDMVKTSAGAIFNIPICKVVHLKDAIYFLKSHGISVVGASEKSNTSLLNSNIQMPVAVVMGNEGEGIQKGIYKLLDDVYSIPMHGKTQSLNVSVAAALFMYELIR